MAKVGGKGTDATQRLLAALREAQPDKEGVVPVDAPALNREYGKSDGWVSTTLAFHAKKGTFEIVREGRRIRGVRFEQNGKAQTPVMAAGYQYDNAESMRDRLLRQLQEHSDERGKVRIGTEELRRLLGLVMHDLNKYLWDLKKEGLLRFKERGSGTAMALSNLQLQGKAVLKKAPADSALAPWQICPECWWERKYHRNTVAQSLVCPPNPRSGSPAFMAAQAKPVGTAEKAAARGRHTEQGAEAFHKVAPHRTERPGPVSTYYECHEPLPGPPPHAVCGQRFNDPVALKMHKDAKHAGEPAPQNTKVPSLRGTVPDVELDALGDALADTLAGAGPAPEAPVTPSAAAGTGAASREATPTVVDWAKYRTLTAAVARQRALHEAEAALRKAGLDEMAKQVAQRQSDSGGPLATELVALLTELGYEEDTADGGQQDTA